MKILLLLPVLAACSTNLTKPQGDYAQDYGSCRYEAKLHEPNGIPWPDVVNDCMIYKKGWKPQ